MSPVKKILPRSFHTLIGLLVFASALGIMTACSSPSKTVSKPAATAQIKTLLNAGDGYTAEGYFKATSSTLVAAAAGDYNSKFYDLGKLLVKDGLGNTIIDLGREMNGTWYEWSVHRAPSSEPGDRNWPAAFSHATGKPIIIPQWGLDFHTFGGQDNPMFITNMMAWMKAHDAIGLYWAGGHVSPMATASGRLLVNQGASSQNNTPGTVNGMGNLMGGRLQYAGVYLPDGRWFSESVDQPVLAPWEHAGYRLILSVPLVPNPPA